MSGLRWLVIAGFIFAIGNAAATTPIPVTDDDYLNYMPSLIQRQDGSRMIVYERLDHNYQNGDLMVTFSEDGETWTEPQEIIVNPPNERHPALVQLPDESYLVYYLSDSTGSYKIHYAASEDGITWAQLGVVDLGWTSEPLVNPTVCLEGDGSLTMTYDRLNVGGYIAHSNDGHLWDHDRTAVSTGPINRIMRHSDGTYVLSYQRRTGTEVWQIDIFTKTSSDRVNWSPENRVTYTQNSHDSFPLELADGRYALFYATSLGGPYDLYSQTSPDGISWTDEENWVPYEGWDTQPHPIHLDRGDVAMAWARGPTQYSTQVYYVELSCTSAIPSEVVATREVSLRVWPNPSPGLVRLSYTTPRQSDPVIHIFDVTGRLVRTLHPSSAAGTILWDGTDSGARHPAVGTYFVRLTAGERAIMRRVALLD